ncbi:MAG: aminotransferase class I/II-fold pyridoxal phosphate-dependent enzyme [Sandaracinaceae bacterium]|nr:aminotransferase class I/II-fold pyridoxal phosphate-dependent enzyme [Sandaracinaceae bacterium]
MLAAAGDHRPHHSGLKPRGHRLISGNMSAHREAETALAAYVAQPAARLFSSGYAANVERLQAYERVTSSSPTPQPRQPDRRLSAEPRPGRRYRHTDLGHLRDLLVAQRSKAHRAFIVTDALFSMDGDVAPLAALRTLANEFEASLYVDEAHSVGVLGPAGRGACAAARCGPTS